MDNEKILLMLGDEEKELTLDELKELAVEGNNLITAIDAISHREGLSREECVKSILEGENFAEKRWNHFLNAYPDAKTDELDADFFASLDTGITPTEAYQKLLITALESKLREAENKEKTLGSAKSEIASEVADKFLEGFFGAKY